MGTSVFAVLTAVAEILDIHDDGSAGLLEGPGKEDASTRAVELLLRRIASITSAETASR